MRTLKEKLYTLKLWKDLVFKYPKLLLEKVDYDAYWKDKRGKEIGRLSDWQEDRAKIALQILSKEKTAVSIMDIGSGDGSILHYMKERRPFSKRIAVDSSKFALDRAKEFGMETIQADITNQTAMENLPIVDYVMMFEILEHIPNSESFLKLVEKKAEKGLLFSFPNTGFFPYRLRMLIGRTPMQWRLHPAEHLRFWTYRDLLWWLDSLGYTKRKIYFYKGVPILNKIIPSLFAAAFVVSLEL